MANFCEKCGSRLDANTGLCPRCDMQKVSGKQETGVGHKLRPVYIALLLVAAAALAVFVLTISYAVSARPAETKSPEPEKVRAVLRSDYEAQSDNGGPAPAYSVFESDISKESIDSIQFLSSLADAPDDAWDVSEAGNGSVLAWVTSSGKEQYDLFIAGDGGVWAPKDCTYLFAEYRWAKSLDFNNAFFVDGCRSMRGMFSHDQFITELDLSGWDTSSVTDMSAMFCFCSSIQKLDLAPLDTSSVTNMRAMFSRCESIEKLDLSGFDTSSVTDMSDLFFQSWDLKEVDLSSFDTSRVTNMSSAFYGCESLEELDLSSFDTSSVTDSTALLWGGTTLEKLTIGANFDVGILLDAADTMSFMSENGTINGYPWEDFLDQYRSA